jgi:hypothetical protein
MAFTIHLRNAGLIQLKHNRSPMSMESVESGTFLDILTSSVWTDGVIYENSYLIEMGHFEHDMYYFINTAGIAI